MADETPKRTTGAVTQTPSSPVEGRRGVTRWIQGASIPAIILIACAVVLQWPSVVAWCLTLAAPNTGVRAGLAVFLYLLVSAFVAFATFLVVTVINVMTRDRQVEAYTPLALPFKKLANMHGTAAGWAAWATCLGFFVVLLFAILRQQSGDLDAPKTNLELIWKGGPLVVVIAIAFAGTLAFIRAWFMERRLWHHNQNKIAVILALEELRKEFPTEGQTHAELSLLLGAEITKSPSPKKGSSGFPEGDVDHDFDAAIKAIEKLKALKP